MSAITLSPTPASTKRSVWLEGVAASALAAVAAELFTSVARVAGVPMRAADPGAAAAKAIPVGGVAVAVVMNAAVGLLLAAGLLRWTKSPARIFATIAVGYTVLSLLGPVFAAHTHPATKVVLSVDHVLAAALIVPRLTVCLSDSKARAGGPSDRGSVRGVRGR